MSPNQAIFTDKIICSSPLAAAHPLTVLSWPKALNPSFFRRACRLAISRNACSLLDFLEFAQAVRYGVLASGKLWKGGETRTPKPFAETLRVRIPPGKAGPAARSESCVVVGRPILRSVDSEVKGRVIEPRKYKTPGAFVVDTGGGRVRQLTLGPLSLPDPAGVEEHGQ